MPELELPPDDNDAATQLQPERCSLAVEAVIDTTNQTVCKLNVIPRHDGSFSLGDLERSCLLAQTLEQDNAISLCFPVRLADLSSSFLSKLERILETTGLPPARLELAFAAGLFTNLSPACCEVLSGLSRLGVSLALTGFGGKGASLECFEKFDFASIFLDPSITIGLTRSLKSPHYPLLLLNSMLAVAAILETTVVVSAVSSTEVMERFGSFGCKIQTGSLFGAPTPLTSTPEWTLPRPSRTLRAQKLLN